MKSFSIFLLLHTFCLFASNCFAKTDVDSKALADFEWFGSLGFPDAKGCPFVRVATGQWSKSGDEPPQNHYVNGFLLSTNGNVFTVLSLDLSTATFTNSSSGKSEHERVGFELLKLDDEASTLRKTLQQRPDKNDSWRRFGEQTTERVEVFTFAWGCWRQGLETEAQMLYELAKTIPTGRGGHNEEPTFRQSVEKDLGHTMMWRAILDFEDVSISRPQLLNKFQRILKNYPHSEHRERAQKTAEVLKRMISEEQVHTSVGSNELARLPVKDQVTELIFQLRDQNGHQYSQPGWCDIFGDWSGATNTPAHRLVALGYAAVPQLIAALDSDTFSRSVGYHRNFYFSHTVLTVGDCASQILQRITGRSFFVPGSTYSYMSKAEKTSSRRRAAEVWWDEFQQKGEMQVLIDAVAGAGRDAPAQAELLVQKYPEVASEALIRGAQSTTNSWVRASLVDQIAKLPDAGALKFLKAELLGGPTLRTRVAAAYGLRQHKEGEAIPAMIREWEALRTKKNDPDDNSEPLIEFLAGCDSVDSVSALGRDLRTRSVDLKLKVVEALGRTNYWIFNRKAETPSGPTLEAIEKVLVTALEDTEERVGMSGSRNGKRFSDPRICDMAACHLAEGWPQRYTFDISASEKTRDRQKRECANVWRLAHGLSALPMPQSNPVTVGREEAAKVTSIEWSAEGPKPQAQFESRLASLKGKNLNQEDLIALFTDFTARPQADTSGLEFKAIKNEDLTGVRLMLKLRPGSPPTPQQGWDVNTSVTLGRKSLYNSSGSGTLDVYSSKDRWEDLQDAIKQAVDGAPDTPFIIRVRLLGGQSDPNE